MQRASTKALSQASPPTGSKRRTDTRASPIPATSKAANLSSMRHFCTLFDHNYIDRGLALHRSLARYCADFTLHVLCLDMQREVGTVARKRSMQRQAAIDVVVVEQGAEMAHATQVCGLRRSGNRACARVRSPFRARRRRSLR